MGQVCPKAFGPEKTAENGAILPMHPTKITKTKVE
jgi:hypothetical protein